MVDLSRNGRYSKPMWPQVTCRLALPRVPWALWLRRCSLDRRYACAGEDVTEAKGSLFGGSILECCPLLCGTYMVVGCVVGLCSSAVQAESGRGRDEKRKRERESEGNRSETASLSPFSCSSFQCCVKNLIHTSAERMRLHVLKKERKTGRRKRHSWL